MVDRDPTAGELKVELTSMREILEVISKTMLTRDLFDAYKEQSNERLRRLEDDQKEWAKTSTAAHIQLNEDSKARHAESDAALAKEKLALEVRINEVAAGFGDYKKDLESVKRSRWNAMLVAVLGLVAGVILKYFVPDIP